jgi:exopolyphosphatase/guanosine-5'-triphosphate,3'-diphosphate pyrophosphatase
VRRLLASIDLGTNTVRALVARPDAKAGLIPGWADQAVVRLGEGLAARGTLAPAAIDRALAAVRRYRDRALALGATEVLLTATAAVRQARDGAEFLARLADEPGIRPRVLSGEEEARLTLLGAAWGLGAGEGLTGLLDVGGGSTEVLVADGVQILAAASLDLGVVHLVERFFVRDPVDGAELAACRAYVDERLRTEAWPRLRPHRPVRLVATAGTPTTLATLDLGLAAYDPGRVQGHRLGAEAIDRLTRRLAALPLAERTRLPGLESGRADVIVPGGIVVAAALAGLALPFVVVSDAGLREGILLDVVGWRPASSRANAPPTRDELG